MLRVRSLLDLVGSSVRETDAEHSQFVSVSRGNIHGGFDQGLPFLDHGAQFVPGKQPSYLTIVVFKVVTAVKARSQ